MPRITPTLAAARPPHAPIWLICFAGCLAVASLMAVTQPAVAQRAVTVTQKFEPAFHIEPLVQKVEGRRGDVIQFQFKVTPASKDADIEVSLVGLRQELNGQITYDESEVDDRSIQLINPGRFTIDKDAEHIIEGVLKVPQGDANYYSYGVLVKDFGNQRDRGSEFDADGNELTKAGINFITQYVLRIDLYVTNARGERADKISITDGHVSVSQGLPQLGAIIRNPSDTAFEFELRAQVKRSPSDRSFKPLKLVMPVRQSLENEQRYVGRILGKSSVLMQEILPEPLMSGSYQLDMQMYVGGRKVASKSFPIEVDDADFPAQQFQIAQVGGDVYVSPSAVELSQARGGNRRISLEFKNNSSESRTIQLDALNELGTLLPGLTVQPKEFTLSAGRSRRLSISLRRTKDFDSPIEYGKLVVTSKAGSKDFTESGEIPVAINFAASEEPKIALGDSIRWVNDSRYPSFRLEVTNEGKRHLPLDARLLIISDRAQRVMIPGGYGKWLMPGETTDLEFRLSAPLLPGEYRLICDLQNGQTPLVKTETITVSDFNSAKTASND